MGNPATTVYIFVQLLYAKLSREIQRKKEISINKTDIPRRKEKDLDLYLTLCLDVK